jgi:hypothetical protein
MYNYQIWQYMKLSLREMAFHTYFKTTIYQQQPPVSLSQDIGYGCYQDMA